MCGTESSREISELFTPYVDLHMFLQRKRLWLFWFEQELTSLQEKVRKFKLMCENVPDFGQATNMNTQKGRLLDHLVDATKNVGEIEFLAGKSFKATHNQCKRLYGNNSRDVALP